ncbi:hypothetical protein Patl1_31171 [Pistacia atlantica]|uniref:Uncharacterized protein n=1 Tax=Pistacia atlantica TaxID=434234 RepID=A0ACC1A7J1_9ROSI|nr:hypothetical protein Patl1_31171 [Pistacia atlantica]
MDCDKRPNRSDIHLPREEAARIEDETKEYFDQLAPQRHTKPQRSEYSSQYVDALAENHNNNNNNSNTEYDEFQRLQSHPEKLVYNGSQVPEEFTETEYYKDLNCIDKQHHTDYQTTFVCLCRQGTGFIKMENATGKCFSLGLNSTNDCHDSCKGNPATNDWIPSADNKVTFSSDKPKRSDN